MKNRYCSNMQHRECFKRRVFSQHSKRKWRCSQKALHTSLEPLSSPLFTRDGTGLKLRAIIRDIQWLTGKLQVNTDTRTHGQLQLSRRFQDSFLPVLSSGLLGIHLFERNLFPLTELQRDASQLPPCKSLLLEGSSFPSLVYALFNIFLSNHSMHFSKQTIKNKKATMKQFVSIFSDAEKNSGNFSLWRTHRVKVTPITIKIFGFLFCFTLNSIILKLS